MNEKKVNGLSGREHEVLYLAADGKSDKEIARALGLTEGSVRTYWERVRRKLTAASRTQAVAMVLADRHREAVESLRLAEFRLGLIFEGAANIALFFMDSDGMITSWNVGVQRVLGYDEADFVGQPYSIIFEEADLLLKAHENEMDKAKLYGRYPDVQWHKRKDGSLVWVSGELFAVRNKGGEVEFFAKVLQDATREKHLEEEVGRLKREAAGSIESHNGLVHAPEKPGTKKSASARMSLS